MSLSKIIHIKNDESQKKLSPAQKKFNALIKKIDAQKKLLAEWQASFSRCQQEASKKLEPLRKTLGDHQEMMALLLDQHFTSHRLTRNQQEKLAYLICDICGELITLHQRHELKPLYNKYSECDFDSDESDEMASDILRSFMEEAFGVELDDEFDFDPRNPQETMERLAEKMQQQEQTSARPQRKKTAKQLAKEAREQEEAANVSKSIQAVYRQLVAALHPDREPDPAERERKTDLMRQVTVAYGKKDLLQLLALQLAVEQIDQSTLNNLAEDRLKHYNKVLKNQSDELKEEIEMMEMEIGAMLQVSPFETITPKRMARMLKEDIRVTQEMIASLKDDLRLFKDVRQLKQWLKGYRIPEEAFDPFF